MPDAFFVPDGGGFRATELTRGPWDEAMQHGGPPAALLLREIEQVDGGEAKQVGRVTYEILRPVPIGHLTVDARVVRPGRRVDLVEGEVSVDGEVTIRARAWRLRIGEVGLPIDTEPSEEQPRAPSDCPALPFFELPWDVGYHTAIELRSAGGGFLEPGPAAVWMRARVPLVAGEETSPACRVAIMADSGNGVSAWFLPSDDLLFINTDLSLHLIRRPVGEWICLDARTYLRSEGIGMAESAIYDVEGRVGRSVQTLFVGRA